MKISRLFLYILSAVILTSCGEDRSDEYYALTDGNRWIESTMKEHYLWWDEMQTPTFDDYFAAPEDFITDIIFKGNSTLRADIFSYVELKSTTSTTSRSYLQETSTYGFDFELITDPTGKTSHTFARVLFVLPNSPASEAGLQRGDWISEINSERVTSSNYGYLMDGAATTFTLIDLVNADGVLSWTNSRALSITASRKVENDPFYFSSIFTVSGKKIAYLVYNSFSTGPNNNASDTQYFTEMKNLFTKIKSESPDAFILDLRYNPGGYLSVAQELASMLAPSSALGKEFLTLKYNSKTDPQSESYNYLSDLSAYNLNLSKIYIITSNYTASASEAVINCLKPYMGDDNVITIGETTVGKNVAMQSYTENNLDFILWPVVAYVENADGNSDYSDGIKPTYTISEKTYYDSLLPLGDEDELLLKNTISLITTGSISSNTKAKESQKASIKSSISLKNPIGLRIK